MTVAGGVAQGVQGMSAASANAKALRAQGDQEYNAANIDANNLRYQAAREGGDLRAEQAASGIALESGSPAEVGAEQQKNYELDALRIMYGGVLKRQNLYYQARVENKAARAAAYSSILGAVAGAGTQAASAGLFKSAPMVGAKNAASLPRLSGGEPTGFYVVK